jgi:hypothetical protein
VIVIPDNPTALMASHSLTWSRFAYLTNALPNSMTSTTQSRERSSITSSWGRLRDTRNKERQPRLKTVIETAIRRYLFFDFGEGIDRISQIYEITGNTLVFSCVVVCSSDFISNTRLD